METATLVLWDIDHTLIETRGVGSELYQVAFEEITGRKLEHKADVTGKTELAILAETLRLHGLDPSGDFQTKYADTLTRLYEQHADELRNRGRRLPGAREALAALSKRADVIQTVLTGNLRPVAATKLRVFGLNNYVDPMIGAYGDDEEDRPKLVPIAQQRAGTRYGYAFGPENTFIVGDSPSDMRAALTGGAKAIGVASGQNSVSELHETGASIVFGDLRNTDTIVDAIGSQRSSD